MENIFEHTLLYDFYGELLTERQQKIYEDVVFNDLSYSELAKEQGVSRQSIHELIKRINRILDGYEEKLHLVEHFLKSKELASKIHELSHEYLMNGSDLNIQEIDRLSQELMELQK